jgi:TetR/AcrR family transcriptional regulator
VQVASDLLSAAVSQRRSGKTRRAEILEAAEALFAEEGYDRARLEDVAVRVGIRRASLVHYFRDKSEIYAAVLENLFGDLLRRYERIFTSGGSIADQLEQTVDAWVDFTHARPAFLRIMMREMADGVSERSRPFADRALPAIAAVGNVIQLGRSMESLHAINPFHFMMTTAGASAFLLLGATILAPEATFPGSVTPDEHRELLLKLMRRLLGTHGPRAASPPKVL